MIVPLITRNRDCAQAAAGFVAWNELARSGLSSNTRVPRSEPKPASFKLGLSLDAKRKQEETMRIIPMAVALVVAIEICRLFALFAAK